MRVDRRTLVLLGVLIVTAALAFWVNGGGGATPVPGTATQPRNAPGGAQQTEAAAPQTPIDVHIEALSAERPPPAGTGRNPFEFRARPAPSSPPSANTAFNGPVTPPGPPGPPPAPPIQLKFIGLVKRSDGVQVAVLTDGRSPPMYGQQGATIDGRYRIVSIGVESIELEHADGRGRQTIRLTGQ